MAAEGEFPKSNGDILFASEVNTFNSGLSTLFSGKAVIVGSGDAFTHANGVTSAEVSEAEAQFPIAKAGTLKNLFVKPITNTLNTAGAAVLLFVNGSTSGVGPTDIGTGTTLVSDTTNTFAVSAGDLIALKFDHGVGTGSVTYAWSYEVDFS